MGFQTGKYYKLTNVANFTTDSQNIEIAEFIRDYVFKVEKLNYGGSIKAISIDGHYHDIDNMDFEYKVFASDDEYDLFTEIVLKKAYCIAISSPNGPVQFFDTLKECQDEIRTKTVPTNWSIYKLAQTAEIGVTFNDA